MLSLKQLVNFYQRGYNAISLSIVEKLQLNRVRNWKDREEEKFNMR